MTFDLAIESSLGLELSIRLKPSYIYSETVCRTIPNNLRASLNQLLEARGFPPYSEHLDLEVKTSC